MDKTQTLDDDTLGSGSGSGYSDLTGLENETDDFGRLLLQYQRDAKRLQNISNGFPQAFRKARPKPHVPELLERQDRERASQEVNDHQRTGSGGSNESDPPVAVPREWGRRARRQTDWIRKIVAPSGNGDEDNEDAVLSRKTTYIGDMERRADSAVDDSSLSPLSRRNAKPTTPSSPSSMRHMNTTLRPEMDSEDQDFSLTSLIASTPARTRLPRKIDELARREVEIERIERHAVASRALDHIDERSPSAVIRRTSSSKLRERAVAEGLISGTTTLPRPATASGLPTSPSRIPRRRRSLLGNKENVRPLNGLTHSTSDLKGAETVSVADDNAQAQPVKSRQRPGHKREDSMNLLRKLARVSSMSPSPGRDKSAPSSPEKSKKLEPAVASQSGRSKAVVEANHEFSTTIKNRDHGQVDIASGRLGSRSPADLAEHGSNTYRRTETDVERISDGDQIDNQATPVVAGAWIDTTVGMDNNTLAPSDHDNLADELDTYDTASRSARPRSALDALMREARNGAADQQYGESTMQSLDDIVHPNLESTDLTATTDCDVAAKIAEAVLNNDDPFTQEQKNRRQEDLAMEAMNKHLCAARTSIKDANQGLRRVENRIETAQENRETITKPITGVQKRASQTVSRMCEACGGYHQSLWLGLWRELCSCFYTWDPSSQYRIRLTWLGLVCLLWLAWYVSESTLCEFYCNPLYASYVRGPPDPEAPRFPFVIPQLLLRPFGLWQPICDAINWGFGLFFHAFFSENYNAPSNMPPPAPLYTRPSSRKVFSHTVSVGSDWIAAATATGWRAARSVVDAVDEMDTMWNDELVL